MLSTRRLLFALLFAKTATLFSQQPAPQSDEQKRQQFLRAREEMHAVPLPVTPKSKSAPKPKALRSAPDPEPEPDPVPPRKPKAETAPRPKPKPEPESTPQPKPKPEPEEDEAPAKAAPLPAAPPKPLPPPAPIIQAPRPPIPLAPITVEKSGFEEERGFQPVPPAGWFTRWTYLSKDLRKQIDKAPVQKRRWRYVVVHNSGTRQGNAKAFEYYHLHVRKMPNGLAYQFVIGNGTSSGDGEIEVGNRWIRQINGGHVHSDYLNNIALGICLVGDLNHDLPTKRQLAALEELIRYLRMRVGQIDHKFAIVKAHREINPPRWPTDCPGTEFPYDWLHGKFR